MLSFAAKLLRSKSQKEPKQGPNQPQVVMQMYIENDTSLQFPKSAFG